MKGISAVIAAILILLITVAILGMAMLSLQRTTQTAVNATESVSGATRQQLSYNFKIENVDYVSGIVNVRNTGLARLDNLGVYLNGQSIPVTYTPISVSTIGDILLDQPLSEGTHTLKITAGAFEQQITVNVPDQWFADFDILGG
jgi:hypothetical protein